MHVACMCETRRERLRRHITMHRPFSFCPTTHDIDTSSIRASSDSSMLFKMAQPLAIYLFICFLFFSFFLFYHTLNFNSCLLS